MDKKLKPYLRTIRQLGFDDPFQSCELVETGWANVVVVVNGQWIFRFGRDARHAAQRRVERDFLRQFTAVSPLPIPTPRYQGSDSIGYFRLPGERLAPEKFAQLAPAQQQKLIARLGAFLTALHGFAFSHSHLSAAPYAGGDFWRELWPLAAPRLSAATRATAEGFFTAVFAQQPVITPVLTHADLGTNNILVDWERGELGGIIDFGDICLADPAVDFAGFYRHFGRPFVETLLNHYQHPLGDQFWQRVTYQAQRKSFFVLYFALTYGFEQHAPAIVAAIEQAFTRQP